MKILLQSGEVLIRLEIPPFITGGHLTVSPSTSVSVTGIMCGVRPQQPQHLLSAQLIYQDCKHLLAWARYWQHGNTATRQHPHPAAGWWLTAPHSSEGDWLRRPRPRVRLRIPAPRLTQWYGLHIYISTLHISLYLLLLLTQLNIYHIYTALPCLDIQRLRNKYITLRYVSLYAKGFE